MTTTKTYLTGAHAIAFAEENGMTTVDVWRRGIGLAPERVPTALTDIGSADPKDVHLDIGILRDECRAVLGRMQHSRPYAEVPARAREYLMHRRLLAESCAGLAATSRARGYVADPTSFDL